MGITSKGLLFKLALDGKSRLKLLDDKKTFQSLCASHDGAYVMALTASGNTLYLWDLQGDSFVLATATVRSLRIDGYITKLAAGSGWL